MIIPAIDLIEGQVVRLKQGDFKEKTVFNYSPLDRIQDAASQGAKLMHLVDLDGAKDPKKRQLKLFASLVEKSPIPIQTGGGIREESEVKALLDLGVSRVVVGSIAVKNPTLVKSWFEKYGAEHLTLALDVKVVDHVPYVAVHGWQELSKLSIETIAYSCGYSKCDSYTRAFQRQKGMSPSAYRKMRRQESQEDI